VNILFIRVDFHSFYDSYFRFRVVVIVDIHRFNLDIDNWRNQQD